MNQYGKTTIPAAPRKGHIVLGNAGGTTVDFKDIQLQTDFTTSLEFQTQWRTNGQRPLRAVIPAHPSILNPLTHRREVPKTLNAY